MNNMKWCVEYISRNRTSIYFFETRDKARQSKRKFDKILDGKTTIFKITTLPRISEMAGKDNKVMLFQKVR